jgi:Protein of unknown function (DUF2798)
MRKLGPRASMVVFTGLVALLMSAAMSFVLTALSVDIDAEFPLRWARGFLIAWAVAWPLAMFVIPLVRRWMSRWVTP